MLYRKDIDGLRALAIVLVVIFHAFPEALPNGFLGVDIFFVISGYLIHSHILQSLDAGVFSVKSFYIRRIKRILPASLVVLLFVSAVGSLTLFENEFRDLKGYLKSTAGFYINFKLMNESGYFDVASQFKPLMHYWSLAVEEQFYMLWPFLAAGLFRFHKDRRLIMYAVIFLVSLAYFFSLELRTYYSPLARAWQVLAGVILAHVMHKYESVETFRKKYSGALLVAAVLLVFAALRMEFPEPAAVLCVLGTVFYILAEDSHKFKLPFNSRPVVFVGLISYSLYLWHWPLLTFARIYSSMFLSSTVTLMILSVAFAFSLVTYYLIEKPLKTTTWDGKKAAGLLLAFAIMFLGAERLPLAFDYPGHVFLSEEMYTLENNSPKHCLLEKLDAKTRLTQCAIAEFPPKSKTQGIILGDSHARALFVGMHNEFKGVTWQMSASGSCSPYVFEGLFEPCKAAMLGAYRLLTEDREITYVVLDMAQKTFRENETAIKAAEPVVIGHLKAISATGKKLILMLPVPEISDNMSACVNKRIPLIENFIKNSRTCRMQRADWDKISKEHKAFIQRLKDQLPDAVVVDPTPEICDDKICNAMKGERFLYIDKDHLSPFASGLVARRIYNSIQKQN